MGISPSVSGPKTIEYKLGAKTPLRESLKPAADK
jgi:hypothetical protein